MRFDVKAEQSKFWSIFDSKLIENGEPFSNLHEKGGEVTQWTVIDKKNSFVDNALSVDLLLREKKIRVNIYVRKDLALFSLLEKHKAEIESMVSVPLQWIKGTKNPNTRRIAYIMPIKVGDVEDYADAIDDILPVLVEMKTVCEKYAPYAFFDF